MPDDARPRSIAELPAQHPASPATAAEARGRFFNTGNAFNVQLPPVPDRIFTESHALGLGSFQPGPPTHRIPRGSTAATGTRGPGSSSGAPAVGGA